MKRSFGRKVAFCGTVVLLSAMSVTSGAGTQVGHQKQLSLSNITIIGPAGPSLSPEWIASAQGFFKRQGLTVNLMPNPGNVSDWIAAMLAGSVQFLQGGTSSQMLAAQQGAPIRTVEMTDLSTGIVMPINAATAAAKHIPTASKTVAQVKAQIAALKNSHLSIATANTSGDSYVWAIFLLRHLGISVDVNAPNDDVNIQLVGSPKNTITALDTGKADGITSASSQSYSIVSPTLVIPLYRLAPAAQAAGQFLSTTTSMINGHPDTVQAVVTAIAQASQYAKSHASHAEQDVAPQLAPLGFPDAGVDKLLYQLGYAQFVSRAYPSKSAYDAEALMVNFSLPANSSSRITLPWSTFTVPRFAIAADKRLHLAT